MKTNHVRRSAAVICVTLLAITAAACSSTSEQVSDQIAEKAQKTLKLDVEPTVVCPKDAEAKKGEKFTCTITVEKVKLPIEVTFTDDETFNSEVQGAVYKKPVLVKNLKKYFTDQGAEVTSLTCPGEKLIVLKEKQTIDCPVEDGTGATGTVKVGLDDNLDAQVEDVIMNN